MLRHGHALRQSLGETAIAEYIHSLRHLPTSLRHAPPSHYFTCDVPRDGQSTAQRHRTQLIDTSSGTSPPGTAGVYALSSTALTDYTFEDQSALSTILVGLPKVSNAEEGEQFLQRNEPFLRNLHHIALPTLSPQHGHMLKLLLRAFPKVKVACDGFSGAFFTDANFFSGVRKALLENDPGYTQEMVIFAEVPVEVLVPVTDGAQLSVTATKENGGSGRTLKAYYADSTAQEAPIRKQRRQRPPHFVHRPLFFYDSVFHAMFVGEFVTRLPWLPLLASEASRETVLPLPLLTHTQHAPNQMLLHPWRVLDSARDFAATLRKEPEVQRVLPASYGELPGSVDDCISAVEQAATHLEHLRSRLANRLESDTLKSVNQWSKRLQAKVLDEVVLINKASKPMTVDTRRKLEEWIAVGEWRSLSVCLTQAAIVLPPSTIHVKQETEGAQEKTTSTLTSSYIASTETDEANELDGVKGVALMKAILDKKELGSLGKALEKEQIDVRVFSAMSAEDFRRVFKSTFGVTKRLQLLQDELRKKVKGL